MGDGRALKVARIFGGMREEKSSEGRAVEVNTEYRKGSRNDFLSILEH